MAIEINFTTDELTSAEVQGLARLLHAINAPAFNEALGKDEPDLFTPQTTSAFVVRADGSSFRPAPDTPVGVALASGGEGATIGVRLGGAPTLEEYDTVLPTPRPYVAAVETALDPAAVFGNPTQFNGETPPSPEDAGLTPEEAFGNDPLPTGAASVAPPAPVVGSVDLDRHGLPWDARIHSTPAKKNGDQSWRMKRGVSELLVKEVEAELRLVMGASPPERPAYVPTPGPVVIAPPPTVPSPPPVPQATEPAGSPISTPQVAPPPPAPPAGPGPSASPSAPPVASPSNPLPAQLFAAFMKRLNVSQNRADDPVTPADVTAALEACGLTRLPDLLKRPDLIEYIELALGDRLAPAA